MKIKSPVIPPYLKKGDTIGIVCPSGYMPEEKIVSCENVLTGSWGFKVKRGKTVGHQYHYFSGTDRERLEDLQQMMDDKEVKAILFGRGGYGMSRIIDDIDFKTFRKNPKWIIGFSDITLLHSHIHGQFNIATLHAPMGGAFNNDNGDNEFLQSLRKALTGKKQNYQADIQPFNRNGKAEGKLIGGNLTLIAHACGTDSDYNTKGKILFLEEIGEYLYNIDRMLYQLKRSGKFEGLAGLVIGGFTNNKDTEIPFGKSVEEIISDIVAEYNFPVCFGFPVSHEKENYALKVGVDYKLRVSDKTVELKEITQ
jgi:muramoyltetrapeptide carboxypeptidase